MAERVRVYIDGFNLYYGIRSGRDKSLYWLDPWKLGEACLVNQQTLEKVHYFSARIRVPEARRLRQNAFLDAIQANVNVEFIPGYYQTHPAPCPVCKTPKCGNCQTVWIRNEEKKTDTAIASRIVADALTDRFDVAIVISADSDLSPPIEVIRADASNKKIIVCFPPNQSSKELKKWAHGWKHISDSMLRQSLMPDKVVLANGYTVVRPASWS